MAIQKLELSGGGVGTCTPRQQSLVHHCTSYSFFVQNMNSSVIMNHLIEEELQSQTFLFWRLGHEVTLQTHSASH